jgi:hypothetical protein
LEVIDLTNTDHTLIRQLGLDEIASIERRDQVFDRWLSLENNASVLNAILIMIRSVENRFFASV